MLKQLPSLALLEEKLQYRFKNPKLLEVALTHRSWGLRAEHNERLEFLGDAVLNLIMSTLLMERFPEYSEGDLSRLRASLVNARMLARKAQELSLGKWLLLGKGEEKSGGRNKTSILASAYEAVLGAVYQDGGLDLAKAMVCRHFAPELEEKTQALPQDYKTRLQELTQKVFKETPVYVVLKESGPDHAKHFVSQILIAGRPYGCGEGQNKKSAEQAAALKTLEMLKNETQTLD